MSANPPPGSKPAPEADDQSVRSMECGHDGTWHRSLVEPPVIAIPIVDAGENDGPS